MKYLSLFVLFLLVSLTWQLANEPVDISEEIHMGMQEDLKKIITQYIKENLPKSKNLKFERLWTEKTKKDQVKATFTYSFEDEGEDVGPARVKIDGYAMLNRSLVEDGEYEVWNFDELYILNNHIQFQEAITIQPENGR